MISTKYPTRLSVSSAKRIGKSVRITFTTAKKIGEKWENSVWNGVVFAKGADELIEKVKNSDTKTRPVIFIRPGGFGMTCVPYVQKGVGGEADKTLYPTQIQIFEFSYDRDFGHSEVDDDEEFAD